MCDRFSEDTDTVSTDENATWGGLGKFEYSQKGLPHALVHATEMVMRGGHYLAFDTTVGESKHKTCIKKPSRLARPYASKNESDAHMLSAVNRQTLYETVEKYRAVSKRSAEQVCATLFKALIIFHVVHRFGISSWIFISQVLANGTCASVSAQTVEL